MRNERKVLKCNSELVDAIFELLFEVFWVAPQDRRRQDAAMVDFDRTARRLVVRLGDTDLGAASAEKARQLVQLTEELMQYIRRIEAARLFPQVQCMAATEAVSRIAGRVREECGALQ